MKKLLGLALVLVSLLWSAACASSHASTPRSPSPPADPLDGMASQRATQHAIDARR